MDIKQKKDKKRLVSRNKQFPRLILTSFVIALFFLLILGGGAFYAKKHHIGFGTVMQWKKQMVFWFPYHVKALFVNPKTISIHIKHINYQHLEYEREEALESVGFFKKRGTDFTYVPAEIEYEGKFIPVKIKLKGDRKVHFEHENQWSFRIKTKNDHTIFRMKNFSIHKPGARNYIHEWIFHEVLEKEGLISGRYFFADVNLNGDNLGLYAFEEHFEKRLLENNQLREAPILKFEDNWSKKFQSSLIVPFDEKSLVDSVQLSYFNKANELLDGFRRGKLSIGSVFDYDKLGKFFAIIDILRMPHAALWKSIRFYYNPITSRLEPIGYDGHYGIDMMGDNYYLTCEDGVAINAEWIHDKWGDWFRMLFNENETFDYNFISSYYNALWEYTEPEYLNVLFNKIGDDLEDNLIQIAQDFPLFADHAHHYGPDLFAFSKEPFYERQKRIREKLNNLSLFAYLEKIENGKVSIKLGNPETLPLVVKGLYVKDTLITPEDGNFILSGKETKDFLMYQSIVFRCDTVHQNFINDSLKFVKLLYSLPGWGQTSETKILPFTPPLNFPEHTDLVRASTSFDKVSFVEIDDSNKSILIKQGSWVIDKDIVFPAGYKVIAPEGVELNLINDACILSYSPLFFQGSEEYKIHIFSSDTSGQGLAILNASETSVFENIVFENLSNISKPEQGWILPSAITFYESNLFAKNCLFLNNQSEDFLNMVRSNFTLIDSEFHNTFSDAFDGDFTDGSISNCKFINCGNDAIDISGSKVVVNNVYLDSIGDKGLSAGEKSELTAKGVTIMNAEIAVASKDLSELYAESINITNCRIGYTAFQKKSEYGGAIIRVSNNRMKNVELQYLLEENSSLIVDGISRDADRANVKDILYGIEYGKSSKTQ